MPSLSSLSPGDKPIEKDPLQQSKDFEAYSYDAGLPILSSASEELNTMLTQKYRIKYGTPPTHFEIKHQRVLDKISLNIGSSVFQGISAMMRKDQRSSAFNVGGNS